MQLARLFVPLQGLFSEAATALILLHVATSASRQRNPDAIAEIGTALGWSHGGGRADATHRHAVDLE